MKKCFGYTRVSDAKKQGDGTSPDTQKEFILSYSKANDIEIVGWFCEMRTAAKRGRPEFNAMVKGIRKGRADGFVAFKVDRSARNYFDWGEIGVLSDEGYDVHFAAETMDFKSRGGRLAADLQAVFATDFIRNHRQNVTIGLYARLERGLYPFKAPLGYIDNGKGKLKTLDPARANLMRQLFELYATGQYSILSVRSELIRRGLTNCNGRPPSKTLIEGALGNPFYCGIVEIRATGKVFQGRHKPLISASLFKRVQEVKSGKRGKKVTRHNHIYRGLFVCAVCEYSMTPEKQKGHVYYRCHRSDCPTNAIREDGIEKAVSDELRKLRLRRSEIEQLVQSVNVWVEGKYGGKGDQLTLQREMEAVDQRIENLTDALIDKHIEPDAYNKRHQALLIKKRELEEKAEQLRDLQSAGDNVRQFLELVKSLADYYKAINPEEKREFVEYSVSNRKVKDKNVELEPSEWLLPVKDTLVDLRCGQSRPDFRRVRDLQSCQIEALVTAAYSDQAKRFGAICRKHDEKTNRSNQNPPQ